MMMVETDEVVGRMVREAREVKVSLAVTEYQLSRIGRLLLPLVKDLPEADTEKFAAILTEVGPTDIHGLLVRRDGLRVKLSEQRRYLAVFGVDLT